MSPFSCSYDNPAGHTALLHRIYTEQYCIRRKIPGPFGERFITYADYIASSQALTFVEEYINDLVLPTYANTHTDASFTGRQTSHFREEARTLIKQSVNANDEDVLLFCGSGSTGAIDTLFRQLARTYQHCQPRPVVFIGPFEHHSNILPWRESDFTVVAVPLSGQGNVDVAFLAEQLRIYQGKQPIIGSFSAASNVTGIIAPIDEITTLLHQFGGLSLWDFAAAAPYLPIDMNPGGLANKDAVFMSAHKLMGGPGTPGILVAKKQLFPHPVPSIPGGGTVHFVSRTGQHYHSDIEGREEGGTPAIIGSIRAGLAFKLKDTVGAEYINRRENHYIRRAIEQIKQYPEIHVLGNLTAPRLSFFAFNIGWLDRLLHPNFVVVLLNDLFGVQARGGCSCAGPYGLDLLDVDNAQAQAYFDELVIGNVGHKPGWIRLNFNYFIPEEEFQFIMDAVGWIARHGWKLLKEYQFDDRTALWRHCRYESVPLDTLHSFLTGTVAQRQGTESERTAVRQTYLTTATAHAGQALDKWLLTPPQTYVHSQIDNPERWYGLADDYLTNDLTCGA